MEHSTNSKILFRSLVNSITLDESREEIESIVRLLLYATKGLSDADILTGREVDSTIADFESTVRRINAHEPIQYILGAASFYGRTFLVNDFVLIPRPETEILVAESLKALKDRGPGARIIDIGTGSGCIAITLALESPASKVTGIDISEDALGVARSNAKNLGATLTFLRYDLLGTEELSGAWDMIVSNPPYVARSEVHQMKRNVKDFEPHLALFVPDNDPLLFYKAIATAGQRVLRKDGVILTEINERLGKETKALFQSHGFESSIITDLSGKDRIVVARRVQEPNVTKILPKPYLAG